MAFNQAQLERHTSLKNFRLSWSETDKYVCFYDVIGIPTIVDAGAIARSYSFEKGSYVCGP